MKYGKLSALMLFVLLFMVLPAAGESGSPFSFAMSSVKEIDISLVSESLSIVERGTDSIEIIIKTNKSSAYDPEISCAGGRLVIIQRNGRLPVGYQGEVEIRVPSSFALLEGKGWIIRTVSGSITADRLCAHVITAGAISGSLKFNDVQCLEVLDVSSISGSIDISGSMVKLLASSKSGKIDVQGTALEIYSDNTSGSIKMSLDKPILFDSVFETVSGSISIAMPEHPGFSHNYRSVSGSIKNDFTGFSGSDKGVIVYKTGQVFIETKSVSGSIKIEKR
ncbi:MAG TPA: DUF4097 family beta strand repeat-containing protein [Treponemataceae bacterium]|mgnify:FL=1|nr:DUF4097 family beta strand repeat-containing protein [Treponemataceae bacterium]